MSCAVAGCAERAGHVRNHHRECRCRGCRPGRSKANAGNANRHSRDRVFRRPDIAWRGCHGADNETGPADERTAVIKRRDLGRLERNVGQRPGQPFR